MLTAAACLLAHGIRMHKVHAYSSYECKVLVMRQEPCPKLPLVRWVDRTTSPECISTCPVLLAVVNVHATGFTSLKTRGAAVQVDSWMQQAGRASSAGATAVAEASASAAQDSAAAFPGGDLGATGLAQPGERCPQLRVAVSRCLKHCSCSCCCS